MASTTNNLGFRRPASAPAIFTFFHASLVISLSTYALYDPTSTQETLGIPDALTARMISLLLICVKGYEVIGSLQDNRAIYWYAVVGRTLVASTMLAAGGGWAKIAPMDFGSATVLLACLLLSSGEARKDKAA